MISHYVAPRLTVPDEVDALVQSLFIGDSMPDENGEETDEPAAGTVEDALGRDYDYEFLQTLIVEGQNNLEVDEDEPMETREPEVSLEGHNE